MDNHSNSESQITINNLAELLNNYGKLSQNYEIKHSELLQVFFAFQKSVDYIKNNTININFSKRLLQIIENSNILDDDSLGALREVQQKLMTSFHETSNFIENRFQILDQSFDYANSSAGSGIGTGSGSSGGKYIFQYDFRKSSVECMVVIRILVDRIRRDITNVSSDVNGKIRMRVRGSVSEFHKYLYITNIYLKWLEEILSERIYFVFDEKIPIGNIFYKIVFCKDMNIDILKGYFSNEVPINGLYFEDDIFLSTKMIIFNKESQRLVRLFTVFKDKEKRDNILEQFLTNNFQVCHIIDKNRYLVQDSRDANIVRSDFHQEILKVLKDMKIESFEAEQIFQLLNEDVNGMNMRQLYVSFSYYEIIENQYLRFFDKIQNNDANLYNMITKLGKKMENMREMFHYIKGELLGGNNILMQHIYNDLEKRTSMYYEFIMVDLVKEILSLLKIDIDISNVDPTTPSISVFDRNFSTLEPILVRLFDTRKGEIISRMDIVMDIEKINKVMLNLEYMHKYISIYHRDSYFYEHVIQVEKVSKYYYNMFYNFIRDLFFEIREEHRKLEPSDLEIVFEKIRKNTLVVSEVIYGKYFSGLEIHQRTFDDVMESILTIYGHKGGPLLNDLNNILVQFATRTPFGTRVEVPIRSYNFAKIRLFKTTEEIQRSFNEHIRIDEYRNPLELKKYVGIIIETIRYLQRDIIGLNDAIGKLNSTMGNIAGTYEIYSHCIKMMNSILLLYGKLTSYIKLVNNLVKYNGNFVNITRLFDSILNQFEDGMPTIASIYTGYITMINNYLKYLQMAGKTWMTDSHDLTMLELLCHSHYYSDQDKLRSNMEWRQVHDDENINLSYYNYLYVLCYERITKLMCVHLENLVNNQVLNSISIFTISFFKNQNGGLDPNAENYRDQLIILDDLIGNYPSLFLHKFYRRTYIPMSLLKKKYNNTTDLFYRNRSSLAGMIYSNILFKSNFQYTEKNVNELRDFMTKMSGLNRMVKNEQLQILKPLNSSAISVDAISTTGAIGMEAGVVVGTESNFDKIVAGTKNYKDRYVIPFGGSRKKKSYNNYRRKKLDRSKYKSLKKPH
jgi:hypothetical protein